MSFQVKTYNFRMKKLTRPLSVILLADLHNNEHGPGNLEIIEAVKNANPDLILCAGDMITGMEGVSFWPAVRLLSALTDFAPVFASNGNHETRIRIYRDRFGNEYEKYQRALSDLGVTVLNNDSDCISIGGSDIRIYGYELKAGKYKKFRKPSLELSELQDAIGVCDAQLPTILIAHNPVFAKTYAAYGADLTVCGHFHGGVMRGFITGRALLNPYGSFLPKYGYGCFEKEGRHMVVTSGLGEHTIPFRIHNPMEVVHIKINFDG